MAHYQHVLGIDEAGLGPILGPLTIGYSAFALPNALSADGILKLDLWSMLGLGREPADRKKGPVVCDSKTLYTPARGIKPLEEEVLSWLSLHGLDAGDFGAFWNALCPLAREKRGLYDWYFDPPEKFPLEADWGRMRLRAKPLARALKQAGVSLGGLGVAPVFEGELNSALRRLGNKSRAEFECITRVIGHFWRQFGKLAVLCDRQGGRERYGRALASEFPEAEVRVVHESTKISTYELTVSGVSGDPRLFVAFIEKGEGDHLPIALGSMLAKYLRELAMHQFNAWFLKHDPALKPTAGYYTDGKRWLDDTAGLRRAIGIEDSKIVRQK
jgi:ribonuclease HII